MIAPIKVVKPGGVVQIPCTAPTFRGMRELEEIQELAQGHAFNFNHYAEQLAGWLRPWYRGTDEEFAAVLAAISYVDLVNVCNTLSAVKVSGVGESTVSLG